MGDKEIPVTKGFGGEVIGKVTSQKNTRDGLEIGLVFTDEWTEKVWGKANPAMSIYSYPLGETMNRKKRIKNLKQAQSRLNEMEVQIAAGVNDRELSRTLQRDAVISADLVRREIEHLQKPWYKRFPKKG